MASALVLASTINPKRTKNSVYVFKTSLFLGDDRENNAVDCGVDFLFLILRSFF